MVFLSDRAEHLFAVHAFVLCYRSQDRIECADTKLAMSRYGNALVRGNLGFEDDVTAFLMDHAVALVAAEGFHQFLATQVARNLHGCARTSSRTR